MSETNELVFSLRERAWLSTTIFAAGKDSSRTEPGQILRIVCDPIGSMISSNSTTPSGNPLHYSCPLALTLSRFRDFKYIGTKISLVPAATTGQVDPAHISTAAGVNNYMHPRDVGNMIHWRRWVGGNFRVPSVKPTGIDATTSIVYYTENDAYDLDAAWLSDSRFNHALVSDGFSMFVRPLRARLETAAAATTSIFGYYNPDSLAYKPGESPEYQIRGQTMITAGDVVPDSWVPNPFAGFKFTIQYDSPGAGNERIYVTDVNKTFPWFADLPDLTGIIDSQVMTTFVNRVKQRFYAPVCILRLPPAYGSVYYYTLYMRHYFAVRRPYITNGVYVAAKIQRFVPTNGDENIGSPQRFLTAIEDPDDMYHVVQMISPDPYGAADSPDTLSMDDLGESIWAMDEKEAQEPESEEHEEVKKEEVNDGSIEGRDESEESK